MTWRGILGVLIFAAFVAFIEVYLGWGALLAPWAALPPAALVAAALLTLASYGLRALRFYDYFAADMSGRGGACVKLMLQHNLWNNLLPMRTGEFSFPWLMSRYFAVPVARSLPALAWFRVLDLHALGLAALAGAAWLDGAGWLAVLAAWLPLPGLLSRAAGLLRRRLGERTGRLAPLLDKLLAGLPRTRRALWRSVLWTYVNWLVKLAAFAWVLTLFAPVPAAPALLGVIAGDLTSVLPVHGVAGAGTYEAGVVAALLPLGLDAGAALRGAVNLHLFILASTVLGGAASLLIRTPPRE